ncbi:MAG: cell division protein CrgA [Actinomycetota bacterium]
MPKSKTHVTRRKQKAARPRSASQRYQLEPNRKQPRRESPRWYGPTLLVLMGLGVVTIVLNYMEVLPGTDQGARNLYLWSGLGLIAVGFIGTTRWR